MVESSCPWVSIYASISDCGSESDRVDISSAFGLRDDSALAGGSEVGRLDEEEVADCIEPDLWRLRLGMMVSCGVNEGD